LAKELIIFGAAKVRVAGSESVMSLSAAGIAEFETLVEWCGSLIDQKAAPGFVVGISGTDSILTFLICAEAFRRRGRPERVIGVHFGRGLDPDMPPQRLAKILELTPTYRWVAREIVPWLQSVAPQAQVLVDEQAADLDDHARWAKLFAISLVGAAKTEMLDGTQNYWVVGTRNATEEALGTYSNLSMAVSLQPIILLWKSDVLRLCRLLGVPEVAVSQSRQVDCDCGRFDLAADHIEEVDVLLRRKLGRPHATDAAIELSGELEGRLEAFIEEQSAASEFKRQIPYKPAPTLPAEVSNGQLGLSRAFSEISGVEVPDREFDRALSRGTIMAPTLESVRDVGVMYGYGFSAWRFAAMGLSGKSLLEQYGFRKLIRETDRFPDPDLKEPHRDLFGPGFVLSDAKTYLELRRAYILVAWKVKDVQVALAIRNNSAYFGRDRLAAPILVSIGRLGQLEFTDLEKLTSLDFVRHFEPIDRLIAHFGPGRKGLYPISREELALCLSDQVAFIRSFEVGFDAWLSNSGRADLLAFINNLSAANEQLPYMGLVKIGQPQWFPSAVEALEGKDAKSVLNDLLQKRRPGVERLALMSGPNGDRP
jgi:NH3-dependent NAD+ synthetase